MKNVPSAMKDCIDQAGIDLKDLTKIFLHQANEKLDEGIVKALYKLFLFTQPPFTKSVFGPDLLFIKKAIRSLPGEFVFMSAFLLLLMLYKLVAGNELFISLPGNPILLTCPEEVLSSTTF